MQSDLIEKTDGWTHVALSGRLDTTGVDEVETRFTAQTAAAGKNALVDFSQVTFLSSMGIRMLLSVAKALARKHARMVLFSPQPVVLESLKNAALDDVIPIADDLENARQLAAG